jgi:hypothetical protein
VVVAQKVVVLTAMGGQDVAGGAVPIGKGGMVPLNEEAPVLRAMEAPPVEEDGRKENLWVGVERVWITIGRLVALETPVLRVPDRGLLVLLKVPGIEPVPEGSEMTGGAVPVPTGMEALTGGITLLGPVVRGGRGAVPGAVPVGMGRDTFEDGISLLGAGTVGNGGYGTGPLREEVWSPVRSVWELVKEPGNVPVGTGRDTFTVGMLPLGPLESAGPEEVEKPPVRSVWELVKKAPVEIGADPLRAGILALGVAEAGGYGAGPVGLSVGVTKPESPVPNEPPVLNELPVLKVPDRGLFVLLKLRAPPLEPTLVMTEGEPVPTPWPEPPVLNAPPVPPEIKITLSSVNVLVVGVSVTIAPDPTALVEPEVPFIETTPEITPPVLYAVLPEMKMTELPPAIGTVELRAPPPWPPPPPPALPAALPELTMTVCVLNAEVKVEVTGAFPLAPPPPPPPWLPAAPPDIMLTDWVLKTDPDGMTGPGVWMTWPPDAWPPKEPPVLPEL